MAHSTSYQRILLRLGNPGVDSVSDANGDESSHSTFEVLRPKAPEPPLVKLFKSFLAELAKEQGTTIAKLMKSGYGYRYDGAQVSLQFAEKDEERRFYEMVRTGRKQFQKKSADKPEPVYTPRLVMAR